MSRVLIQVQPPRGSAFRVWLSRVPAVGEIIENRRLRVRVVAVAQIAYDAPESSADNELDGVVWVEPAPR